MKFRSLLVVAVMASGSVFGDAKKDYADLFGEKEKRVLASASKTDDGKFAVELLGAAELVDDNKPLQAMLLEKTVEFGAKDAEGLDAAKKALELLEVLKADEKKRLQELKVSVYRAAYRLKRNDKSAGQEFLDVLISAGDACAESGDATDAGKYYSEALRVSVTTDPDCKNAIQEKVKTLAAIRAMENKRKTLSDALAKDSHNVANREKLIDYYVFEADRPDQAVKLLNDKVDAKLQKLVPLAAMTVEEVPVEHCIDLGMWYRERERKIPLKTAKVRILSRALDYYNRYLQNSEAKGVNQLKAKIAAKDVEKSLSKLEAAGASRWTDVLALVDPAKHTVRGKWVRTTAGLEGGAFGIFGVILPWTPKGSYEAVIEMAPRIGIKDLNFQIPVGSRCCMVVTNGWGGKIAGLDLVGGKTTDVNPTKTQPYKPVENQLYRFRIVVRVLGKNSSIQVFLNKQPYIAWKGPIEALSMRPDWVVGEGKTLGFLGVASSATLKSVNVRRLGG